MDILVATENYKTLLGRGATGEVYLGALHGAPIAAKRLRAPAGASAEVLAALTRRFRAELATLSTFQHPRIVRLLHTCEATGEPEHPFVLVFELLEGGSLADRLRGADGGAAKRGPALTALQRVDAALGIAHGLKYLHGLRDAGEGAGGAPVVHRDVKSANVGFSLQSGGGAGGELYAKLIDCGLAKALRGGAAAGGGGGGGASFSSGVLGTPGYMAPELADGVYTVASEVYSLGVVLLELLTGQCVGSLTASTAREAVEDAEDDPAPIEEMREKDVWPRAAAEALAALVAECIYARPRRRPQSLEPVVARLQTLRALVEHAAPMAECIVCREEVAAASGVRCKAAAGAHFCCRGCLQQHVVEGASVEVLRMSNGRIACVKKGCSAQPWELEELGGKLEAQALVAYGVGMRKLALTLTLPPALAVQKGAGGKVASGAAGARLVVVSTLAGSGVVSAADGVGSAASFGYPTGVCVDFAGNIFVADEKTHKISRITPAGVVSTLAGSGAGGAADGVGSSASFGCPVDVCVDAAGNIIVADTVNHKIRRITPAGEVSTLAGSGVVGAADGVGSAASFFYPHGVCVDAAGNILVADRDNNKIRRITPAGEVSSLAGSGARGAADGVGSAASFSRPYGVCMDAAGNILVADYGNSKIRRVTPAGEVSTLAGSDAHGAADGASCMASVYGAISVCVDATGNIFFAVSSRSKIGRISPAGEVSILAGSGVNGAEDGVSSEARFNVPVGVCVDATGNILVADAGNRMIRRISSAV